MPPFVLVAFIGTVALFIVIVLGGTLLDANERMSILAAAVVCILFYFGCILLYIIYPDAFVWFSS